MKLELRYEHQLGYSLGAPHRSCIGLPEGNLGLLWVVKESNTRGKSRFGIGRKKWGQKRIVSVAEFQGLQYIELEFS